MSAILAILLMLSGAILVPHAFAGGAGEPADAVQCNPAALVWDYPTHAPGGPGDTFTMYADVVGVTSLFSFQVGFYFDKNAIQIISIAEGGFLSSGGVNTVLSFPGSIDNVNGVVSPYGWSLTDTTKAATGSGHLITVQAKINPALWPPYTGVYPGSPVAMMDLSVSDDNIKLILMYNDGVTDITPLANNVFDGTFELFVTPHGPTAAFTIAPNPVYVGTDQLFDASGSLPGFDGYASVPIVNYHWVFADGNVTDTPTPITSHMYGAGGAYDVFLTVTDASAGTATTDHVATVQEVPTGCNIDLYSQSWRYIDPMTIQVPNGALTDAPCDLFRPGDYVQMYAYVSYANDAVQHQLVSFQVFDNLGNTVLVGTAFSDAFGIAEYDFRVPWPCVGVEGEFGTWSAVATWQCGSLFPYLPPFEKTQIDTMPFKVGWGLWITDISTDKALYHKSEYVVVKIHVENDYMVPVTALATVDIYDDLLVPINGPAYVSQVFPVGITEVTFAGIHVEKWAFCGVGTAKANLFTTWPILMGTSFCPEVTVTFDIKP